jgi:ActR/RegA family two-component response regulator
VVADPLRRCIQEVVALTQPRWKDQALGQGIIMLTGFGDLMTATGKHSPGIDAIVSKPVTLDALTEAILKVTRSPQTARR